MPMKLNVGLAKKIGQRDYGSLGASCNVEVELDGSLLRNDLEAFHNHVRNAFTACRQAVHDELARHQDQAGANGSAVRTGDTTSASQTNGNGVQNGNGNHGGNGSHGSTNGNGANGNGSGSYRASSKQMEYIQQLARQIKGLGVRRLDTLAQNVFGKPVAGLTSLDASGLIDTLKAIKSGEINLDTALSGAAP
jgi:hypothetical protein